MRRTLVLGGILTILMSMPSFVSAQDFSDLDKSPMDAAAFPKSNRETNKKIKVYYSRPQLKGRSLSELAPNDKVWRTGANEATEVVLYKDMKMGGEMVPAGTYTMYTIPGAKEWTVILSKDTNVWGAYSYNEANDVVRIKVPATSASKSLEAFSIAFDDTGNMHMGWDKARVTVPFSE